MLIQYDGVHSIDFFANLDDHDTTKVLNTWLDLHLVPTSPPSINLPDPEFKFYSIPGSQEFLDLTDYFGGTSFAMPSGSWEFIVDLNFWKEARFARAVLAKNLHSRRLCCRLTDDPRIIYHGRFKIDSFKSNKSYPVVSINYSLSPKANAIIKEDDTSSGYVTLIGKTQYEEFIIAESMVDQSIEEYPSINHRL